MSVQDTLAERGARYGDFTDHAAVCQRIKLAMIAGAAKWASLPDTHKQALEVIADKIARILTGDPNYADNWHDIQGYAKLVEDRLPRAEVHTMSNPPGEDIYAEFAARLGAAPTIVLPATPTACPECGYPTDAAGTHYATCSQLTAPEEYKAEAQVAFDEATGALFDDLVGQARVTASANWLAEKIARQVSAGTIVEPAAAMDDDSPRMQAIGQNGNNGEHYDDPFAGAPEWAKYKAQDANGRWYWYECAVYTNGSQWVKSGEDGRLDEAEGGEPNPDWRDTLVTRT